VDGRGRGLEPETHWEKLMNKFQSLCLFSDKEKI